MLCRCSYFRKGTFVAIASIFTIPICFGRGFLASLKRRILSIIVTIFTNFGKGIRTIITIRLVYYRRDIATRIRTTIATRLVYIKGGGATRIKTTIATRLVYIKGDSAIRIRTSFAIRLVYF